jgi:hypothetical protein
MSREALTGLIMKQYGICVGGKDLRQLLGFKNARAFAQSVRRGHLPLNFLKLPGRRGRFVLATEIAKWLEEMGSNESSPVSRHSRKSRQNKLEGTPM